MIPTWKAILRGRCPSCRLGSIFRGSFLFGFPRMYPQCPVCGLNYNREPGYFLGAMYISYAFGAGLMVAFFLLFWRFTQWRFSTLMIASFLALLPFVAPVTLFARILWIYIDRKIDPE